MFVPARAIRSLVSQRLHRIDPRRLERRQEARRRTRRPSARPTRHAITTGSCPRARTAATAPRAQSRSPRAMPIAAPISRHHRRPAASTMPRTLPAFAPSAMRTPISRVRCATEYASTPYSPTAASSVASSGERRRQRADHPVEIDVLAHLLRHRLESLRPAGSDRASSSRRDRRAGSAPSAAPAAHVEVMLADAVRLVGREGRTPAASCPSPASTSSPSPARRSSMLSESLSTRHVLADGVARRG